MCGQVENGLTAYELAVQQGYAGSLDDWLVSLQGKSVLHIKPLNLSAVLCIKSLKYFNLCDKITFIGIAHGDTGMRAAEASRRLVLFLLLRGVLK